MKNLMTKAMILASVLFNLQANACAVPLPPQDVIKYRTFGGMPGPNGIESIELSLKDNGAMVFTKTTRGWNKPAETETKILGQISATEMNEIQETLNQISGGDLMEPTTPPCMDAPTVEYSVFKDGQEIKIHRIEQCRELPLKDKAQRPAADAIKKFLTEYLQLAYK